MTLPIYDRYGDPNDKGNTNRDTKPWKSLKFVPGRVVQVPELNEMQSVLHDNVKEITDTLYKDGSVISGLQPTVGVSTVTLGEPGTPNKIYAFGYVIDLPDGVVNITNSAEEKIGVKLTPTLITEVEDPELTDPVTGARNLGLPGAYRLSYTPTYTNNDPDAFTLHTLRFGQLVTVTVPPEFDSLNKTLAQRTFEESGSYLVEGLETEASNTDLSFVLQHRGVVLDELAATVTTVDNPLVRGIAESDEDFAQRITDETITATIRAGIAYVSGFRIQKPSPTKLLLPKAKDLRDVNNEFHTLIGSHTLGNSVSFPLFSTPVSLIAEATMQVRTTISPLRSPFVSTDFLATDGPITGIVSVTYTAPGPTVYGPYLQGVHFNFTGTGLTWLNPTGTNPDPSAPGGSTPGPALATVPQGATYTVVLDYVQTLEIGDISDNKDIWLDTPTTVELTGSVGGTPVTYTPNGDLVIDYSWYLNRKDTIYLDQFGEIKVYRGQSDRIAVSHSAPSGTLGLSEISLIAAQAASSNWVVDLKLQRLTMKELQDIVKRLERTEYNQAITNLNVQAQLAVPNGVPLKGIFTDPFVNLDKIDANPIYEYDANPVAIRTGTKGEIEISENKQEIELTFNATLSTQEKVVNINSSRFVTRDYTLVTDKISQLKATKAINVNPYSAFTRVPIIYCDPPQAVSSIISQTLNLTNTSTGAPIVVTEGSFTQDSLNSLISKNTQNIAFQGSARFASSRTVKLKGEGFAANEDNLALTIDGTAINIIPDVSLPNGTTAGTSPYLGFTTVKANASGLVDAQFTIPANTIFTGRRKVLLFNTSNKTAETTFDSIDPINIDVTLVPNVTINPAPRRDPVAQTFAFASDTLLAGVDLYFKAKPSVATDTVTVEIRPTIAGQPVRDQLLSAKTRVTLTPSQVQISPNPMLDPTSGTIRTRVLFDDPAFCAANVTYSVVVLTESDDYEIWIATIGNRTVDNSEFVNAQVADGVLLTSANGETWTADQASDLMFALVTASVTSGVTEVRFDPVTFTNPVNKFSLSALQTSVEQSTITWQYSTDAFATNSNIGALNPSGQYLATANGVVISGPVSVRALINNSSLATASSLVQIKDVKLRGTSSKILGDYVSKTIPLDVAPTSIRATVDLIIPPGTSVNAYYGFIDLSGQVVEADGFTPGWTSLPLVPGQLPAEDPGFIGYAYEDPSISTAEKLVKIRLELNGNGTLKTSPIARRLITILS
jgi:hypothetical protein